MKKFIIIALAVAGLFSYSQGQTNKGTVKVKIIDEDEVPVEFAAVILQHPSDSSIVKIAIADSTGTAVFEGVPYNEYYIKATSVGYKEEFSERFTLNGKLYILPHLKMSSSMVLDEVVVTGAKSIVEHKLDRTVVNVGAALSASGGNLSDVLNISPGITVDNNGGISLRGKSGVVVLIDGRSSYLKGADLANYINSMPANQLAQIEIMTNPPAKYDAAGNAGVINIITKRSESKGWSMDVASSYRKGKYYELINSLGVTYHSAKINAFGNISYSDQNNFDEYDIARNFKDNSGNLESVYRQNTFTKRENDHYNLKAGLDFFPGEKTTIGFIVSGQHNTGVATTTNRTLLTDADDNLLATIVAPATTDSEFDNLVTNVHFNHLFGTSKREISADVDYLLFNSKVKQQFNNTFYNSEGARESVENFENILPQDIEIYSAKIDYVHPIGENRKLEAGVKSSYVYTDNDAQYFDKTDDVLTENTDLSNHFKYTENVNAGYLNYNQKINKWQVQAGVRVEQTIVEGEQLTLNETFKNDYFQVFPTLYLTYDIDAENQVALSYGKRLERPDYRDLNPFRFYYDRFTYEEGNPNLNPQFSHNVELSYLLWEGAVTTTAYYNETTDIIQDVIYQNPDKNETFIKKDNLNDMVIYGINLNAEVPITNAWGTSLYLDYSRNSLTGTINSNVHTISANTFSAFMLHQYKFEKGWSAEMGAWYTSRSITDTFIQEPYGRFALAIGKSVFNNKGKIRLSANDIFHWTKFEGRSGFPNTDIKVKNTWQTRTIKLAFTYRINKGLTKKSSDRKSGVETESERIGTYE